MLNAVKDAKRDIIVVGVTVINTRNLRMNAIE